MRQLITALVMALPAAGAVAADRPPPPVLAPVGPWVVEAETDSCLFQRSYGPQRITVAFQPVFNLEQTEVIVLTPEAHADQRLGDAKLMPGPNGAPVSGSYSSVGVNSKPERFTRITVDRSLLDTLQTADTLTIRAKPVDIQVRLAAFPKAMKAFETCKEDLLRSWGVDPATVAPERMPKPRNVVRYFSPESYPSEAVHSGIIGRVIAVLQVDASGKVTACRITASAGELLNAGTCRQAMKVPFEPGTDADGEPVPSIYVLPVHWLLP